MASSSDATSRHSSVLFALASTVLVAGLILLFLVPSIFHQFGESIEKLPLALRAIASRLKALLSIAQQRLQPEMFERLKASISGFEKNPEALTSRLGSWLSRGLLGLVGAGTAAIGLVVVPFFVYYPLLDLDRLKLLLERQIPERYRGTGIRLFEEVGTVARGYVQGRFLIARIMATIYATGLLVLRIPLWAGIGLIAGIVGIIPYFGVASGLLLSLGFAALDGAGPSRFLGVLAVFFIAQMTEDYVLTPRIIGNKLALHPMLVFIALIIAGDLYGLLGLVLAIPVLAVLKVFVVFFEGLYLNSNFYLASVTENAAGLRDIAWAVSGPDLLPRP